MVRVEDLTNKNAALMKKNEDFASKIVALESKDSALKEEDDQLNITLSNLVSQLDELKAKV